MVLRLKISEITPDTADGTCKVQVVDISRHRQSHEKKIKFQNLILEDEDVMREQQIRVILYGDNLGYYAAKFTLFFTRVKVSKVKYGRLIHKFYWIIDKETLLEHVPATDTIEKALPTATKLTITPFNQIRKITPAPRAEIDFVGVILPCGPSKNAGRSQTRCCELTVIDDQLNHFSLTLWDDFAEVEGTELEAKVKTE